MTRRRPHRPRQPRALMPYTSPLDPPSTLANRRQRHQPQNPPTTPRRASARLARPANGPRPLGPLESPRSDLVRSMHYGMWHRRKERSLTRASSAGRSTEPRSRRRWRLTAIAFAVAVLAASLANHGPPDNDDRAPVRYHNAG